MWRSSLKFETSSRFVPQKTQTYLESQRLDFILFETCKYRFGIKVTQ